MYVASHVDQNVDCNFTAPCHLLWHYAQTHANKVSGILYLLRRATPTTSPCFTLHVGLYMVDQKMCLHCFRRLYMVDQKMCLHCFRRYHQHVLRDLNNSLVIMCQLQLSSSTGLFSYSELLPCIGIKKNKTKMKECDWGISVPCTCAVHVHIEDCESWWLSCCCNSLAEHWLHKLAVRFPASAGLFTFNYFCLKTSKFSYLQCELSITALLEVLHHAI